VHPQLPRARSAERAASPDAVFAAVVEAASALLDGLPTSLVRFEDDGTSLVVAVRGGGTPTGARAPAQEDSLAARVRGTGRAVRIDDFAVLDVRGVRAGWGVRAAVAVPVRVEGRSWGLLAATSDGTPLPADTEHRLARFTDVVAAAVGTAQAWRRLQDLAGEQAALRRVAELVARGSSEEDFFAAVAAEASALVQEDTTLVRLDGERAYTVVAVHGGPASLGTHVEVAPEDEGLVSEILRTGRAARLDDYGGRAGRAHACDDYGVRASVGVPITVDERVWGVLAATSTGRPLAADVEQRLGQFADLLAGAVAGVQARAHLQELADEQRALRTVAELVARGAPPDEVVSAVAAQASGLLRGVAMTLTRFDGDRHLVVVASHEGPAPVGVRIAFERDTLPDRVLRGARAARVDDYRRERDADLAAQFGLRASVAAPITVAGQVWGMLTATSAAAPLPAATEHRLEEFAGLVGAALANVQARSDLQVMAEESTALRRVADLVAHGAPLGEVFTAVATEASALLGNVAAALLRYDGKDAAVVVAARNSPAPVGLRVPAADDTGTGGVRRTGRPVRVDSFDGTGLAGIARELGVSAAVAVPVVVEGRVWGALTTSSGGAPPPPGTEDRLAPFAELAAAAIANAENRAKVRASRARVVATADETRRRLQRDVHDSAQQRLVHAIITLKLAREAMADGRDPAELVEEALRNAERANRDLRDVVRGILPAALTRGGLAAGLESLVEDVALPVRLRVTAPRLSPALETTAYFVVAEALTNVVKHAHASRAAVDVRLSGDVLVLDVRDDGTGGADATRGTGLTGLLDRVEAGEGTLTLSSPVGIGTTVHVELPVSAPGAATV
jgi:signal transduction histidine kinase/putative methionine-R-sulfoxide reductase with GAF domain